MGTDNGRKLLTLGFFAVLLFFWGNQVVSLTNPDEVFYTGTAKEMIEQKSWLVPCLFGQPQFEKPILAYWLIRIALMVFGMTAFAARFFPAFFGLIGVFGVYFLAARVFNDRKKAFLSAFVLMSGVLYIGLAKTVFTDMIFSVFIGLSLGAFYLGYHEKKWKTAGVVLFFVFSGLAVLTKGLLGFTMPFGAAGLFLLLRRDLKFLWCRGLAWGVLLFLGISVPWYALMVARFGSAFIDEFYYNDHIRRLIEAEHAHNDTWYFYPASTLLCFFPWTLFVAAAFGRLFGKLKDKASSPFFLFLACWVAVPFILVQAAHSKLVSYILPIYPALAIITGDSLREMFVHAAGKAKALALVSLGVFLLLPPAAMVAAFKYPEYVGDPGLVCVVLAVFSCLVLVQLGVLWKKARLFPYAAAFNVVFLFFTFLAFNRTADDFVASRHASEYLRDLLTPGEMEKVSGRETFSDSPGVLCSKMLVRGVRFYSGRDVAVLKLGGARFFSPHPIPFLDSAGELEEYLKVAGSAYGILEKKDVEAARDALKGKFDCRVLKQFGSQFVVEFKEE